jgi:hypothetical protein
VSQTPSSKSKIKNQKSAIITHQSRSPHNKRCCHQRGYIRGKLWYHPGQILVFTAKDAKTAKVSDLKNQSICLPLALLAAWR